MAQKEKSRGPQEQEEEERTERDARHRALELVFRTSRFRFRFDKRLELVGLGEIFLHEKKNTPKGMFIRLAGRWEPLVGQRTSDWAQHSAVVVTTYALPPKPVKPVTIKRTTRQIRTHARISHKYSFVSGGATKAPLRLTWDFTELLSS